MNQNFKTNFNFNSARSKTPSLYRSGYSTPNNFSKKGKFNSSLFDMIGGSKESNLTSYYKEFFLNQVNVKLDERIYDLISKMDDPKQYNEAKEQYDEAKRLLIKEAMNDKYDGYLNLNKNSKRINLTNYL